MIPFQQLNIQNIDYKDTLIMYFSQSIFVKCPAFD